jgi:hypothetical protein
MEAHAGKIRVFDPGLTLPTVHFRIAARGAPEASRAPALERLIARAGRPSSAAVWRTEAFRAIAADGADPPPIAVVQLRASGDVGRYGWVAVATPVHLVAGMSTVHLAADGILDIEASEADRLTEDFNRSFGNGGARLTRGLGSGLLCVFDAPLEADTTPPEEALGGDVWAHQPRGKGSAGLRRLASEIEMWLFDHPVNAARRARGVPVINALWLWGGGAGDAAALPVVAGWTAGADALFSAFHPRLQYPPAADSSPAASGSARSAARARSGVVVVASWPGTTAWRETEQRWLSPALEDLKAGRLERIEISAAAISFHLSARGLLKFWRRSRPWWESFGVEASPREETRLGN